jgi:hypothetical protein
MHSYTTVLTFYYRDLRPKHLATEASGKTIGRSFGLKIIFPLKGSLASGM